MMRCAASWSSAWPSSPGSLNAIRVLLAGNDRHGPTFEDWATVARQQLEVIDQRVSELNHLKTAIEQCLACGCQKPQRCALRRQGLTFADLLHTADAAVTSRLVLEETLT